MSVRAVVEKDFEQITYWANLRGILLQDGVFPSHGLIEPNVAAGFLYCTDSCVAVLDCYISNPESDSHSRDLALDEITKGLIKIAKSMGYTEIKCDTQLSAIKTRAIKHGFKSLGQFELFVMEI